MSEGLTKKKEGKLEVSSILPESFLTGGILRVRDLVDRRVGNSIGIKRIMGLGRTGYPEKIPTHVYIAFQHFFELNELLNDVMRSETENPRSTKKWIKFVQCHWERDMYKREAVHSNYNFSNNSCDRCLSYVHDLNDMAIWWFALGTEKFIKMTFKNFANDSYKFECCAFWIKIFGMFEVNLEVVSAAEETRFRRNYRVPNTLIKDLSTIEVPLPIESLSQPSSPMELDGAYIGSHAVSNVETNSNTGKPEDRLYFRNASEPLQSSSVELRDKLKTIQLPEDNHQPLVLIDGESRMLITTKHLLTCLTNHWPLHIQTTFNVIVNQSMSVFGTTDIGGRFTPLGLAKTNNDYVADYEFIFRSIKHNISLDYNPDKLVTMAIPAIQMAAQNVFGTTTRIYTCSFFIHMCVYNRISKDDSINLDDRKK